MRRVALVLVIVWSPLSLGCPTCTCANPTLSAVGADQPFDGRLRLAAGLRGWAQWEGTAQVDRALVYELRLDLVATYSPWRWLTVQVAWPFQARERIDVSLARERGVGPGELEVGARALLLGASGFRPRHLLSLSGALRLPTAPTLVAQGTPLSTDAQLGPGAFTGSGSVSWTGFYGDRWSSWVLAGVEFSSLGRFGLQPGPAVSVLAQGQYQPLRWLGVRLGVDGRYEWAGWQGGSADGRAGLLVNTITDVVFALGARTLLSVGARVPVLDLRGGGLEAGPTLTTTLIVDV